jgi:hypothetical protein
MLKYCYEKWNKNRSKLEEALRKTDLSRVEYRDLLVLTVENILNDNDYPCYKWSTDEITEINDGSYQGTLLYLIPEDTYQPSEYEYLMTYVNYGSCSYCDTLQSIQPDCDDEPNDEDIKNFMSLCKDFVTNMIKPYNAGWRQNDIFEHMTMEETE